MSDAADPIAPSQGSDQAVPAWLGPAAYAWGDLRPLQVGRYAEYLTKLACTAHGLDVYTSEVDDRGIDFVARLEDGR